MGNDRDMEIWEARGVYDRSVNMMQHLMTHPRIHEHYFRQYKIKAITGEMSREHYEEIRKIEMDEYLLSNKEKLEDNYCDGLSAVRLLGDKADDKLIKRLDDIRTAAVDALSVFESNAKKIIAAETISEVYETTEN